MRKKEAEEIEIASQQAVPLTSVGKDEW